MGLQGRRVPVGALSAVGYGESAPIADNSSDAGRETNRRIEFRLVAPANVPAANASTASAAPGTDGAATDAAADGPPIEAQKATDDTPRPKLRPDNGGADTGGTDAGGTDAGATND